MNEKKKLKGGIFFYVFYLSFYFACSLFIFNILYYLNTGYMDKAMTSKSITVIAGFLGAFHFFKKKRKLLIDSLMGSENEGIRAALADGKTRLKADRALHTTVQFGAKKGIKKFRKLEEKAQSYDDKAVLCYIMGVIHEVSGDSASAMERYQRAIQYRPFYTMASDKVKELTV